MAYTIKPSIGMMPINDIDKAMATKGFIKELKAKDIEKVTQIKHPTTGAITQPGIKDPSLIAVCANQKNNDNTIDRTTIRNSLNLDGKPASDFLLQEDKEAINAVVDLVNQAHSLEIQLLRDELYHMKTELVRTGHMEDTSVANGFIDGFKKGNLKYNDKHTEIEAISGSIVTQTENIFDQHDWLIARKDKGDEDSNFLGKVTSESGNNIKLDIGTSNMFVDKTILMKSLGEYNKASYSFSKMSYGTPGTKEKYTMLNDDSNVAKKHIKIGNSGYATLLKVPSRCAGFLTKFIANGRTFGNPGAITCHVIKGTYEYIKSLGESDGLSKAKADGNYIAQSSSVSMNEVKNNEIVFDFTRLDFNPGDSTSTLYPEIEGIEYCFVLEAENVTDYDYWEIEMGHKSNVPSDLQTNNKTFLFYNKDVITTENKSFIEEENIDMLYMVTTKEKEKEDEVPFSSGLYTTLNNIKISKPMASSRARLTLEVNKEGNFVTVSEGAIRAELDTIEMRKADGNNAEQTVIGGGDDLVIGNTIVKAKTTTPNTVTVDKNIYIEPMTPIYRCGYKAQIKTRMIEENPETGIPSVKQGSTRVYPLELVAVIPSGRTPQSNISDRLIFEVDIDSIKDVNGDIVYFNDVELQVKWNSFLSSGIIHTQAKKGNDYIGRIHSMSLAFDKTV